ncbi:MAG: hypothetical protein EOO41_05405 [Methanobacteriota archaeon]|nr:MAG: hypothetical protein EOO41_05405 [Euryarchaeota archaeon]
MLWQCAYLRGLSVDAHARALDQPNAGSPASLAAQLEQAERDLHDLLYTPNCVNAEEAEVQLSAFGRGQSNDMLRMCRRALPPPFRVHALAHTPRTRALALVAHPTPALQSCTAARACPRR